MQRLTEWIFATIGTVVCVGGSIVFWQAQSSSVGSSLWPMPALALIEMSFLGLAGLIAVSADSARHTLQWGIITWAVCGGLTALMIIGAWTLSPLLLVAVLSFAIAAILSDRRRSRAILPDLGVFTVSLISNAAILFLFIVAASV